jgi:hypothetical protein
MDIIVQPSPNITIFNADCIELPVWKFDLLVIVESDPETWMASPTDDHKVSDVLDIRNHSLIEELEMEDDAYVECIWIRCTSDESCNFFTRAAAGFNPTVTFTNISYDYEAGQEPLEFYLHGLKERHPEWKIGVIGAMYEDEVMRIANLFDRYGFAVTVLVRHCVSNSVFVNLDKLVEEGGMYLDEDNV